MKRLDELDFIVASTGLFGGESFGDHQIVELFPGHLGDVGPLQLLGAGEENQLRGFA